MRAKSSCALLAAAMLAQGLGVGVALAAEAPTVVEPSSLRVLYVGNDPRKLTLSDMESPDDEDPRISNRLLALAKARTPDFDRFLHQHFKTVAVVFAPAYQEAMSASYDVTIFDAPPPPIQEEADPEQRYPASLSPNFSAAALMISGISAKISEPLGYKFDWLCLCLDAHAHGMKLDHPVFNTPFRVRTTIEYRPTPENYREFYGGRALPDTMPMWRVQKRGFSDGDNYPAGLVSSGAGFENAPDAEVISNGACEKSSDAVAIGRHGNFFHWGFSAAPSDMTEEARLVFVNAIHYIAKFKGQRPYSRRIYPNFTREEALERAYSVAQSSEDLQMLKELQKGYESRRQQLLAMQKVGQELSAADLQALNEPLSMLPTWLKSEEMLGGLPDSVVAKFGADVSQYLPYYEANLPYLKPGAKKYDYLQTYEVDEDVRSLATANNDVRLLELCVAMLESKLDTEKAQRILTRYTDQRFQSAEEWRQWLESHRGRIYFSDEDGYRFHVIPESRTLQAGPGAGTGPLLREPDRAIQKQR